jgi:hypothetical protein
VRPFDAPLSASMVDRVSAIAAFRRGDPPPVSYLNAWWAVVQWFLVGVIILFLVGLVLMLAGFAGGLPLGDPGGTATPLASTSDLLRWPFDPSLLWFRLLDVFALVTVTLWMARRLRDRFFVLDLRLRVSDALLSAGGLIVIAAMSHWAAVVAVFVVAGLLRRADTPASVSVRGAGRHWGRWMLAAWVVAILGSLLVINVVPVGAQAGSSCSISGGSVQPPARTTVGADQPATPYHFRRGGTFTSCAVTQNRAWFVNATVLGVDATQLATAPWRVTLVHEAGAGFRPIRPLTLTPRDSRELFVLVRFTACRPGMSGRTYTLSTLPLRVHAYGRTQTDPVPLSQAVQTTCP